jgi:hypothetical protein
MLITLLSFFDRCRHKRGTNNDYHRHNLDTSFHSYSSSPTSSIVYDIMSADGDYDDDHDDNRVREDGEWEHVRIPISEDEDYEVVFSPSDFCQQQQGEHQQQHQEEIIVDTNNSIRNSSNNIIHRVQEWNRQRNLQRNQLGASISKTFTELSREEPDQMEEDAIKRAMELSMLDVALVYHRHDPSQQRYQQQQKQQILPHKILDVSENAHPTVIKTAYRKLARLHVSIYHVLYLNFVLRCIGAFLLCSFESYLVLTNNLYILHLHSASRQGWRSS